MELTANQVVNKYLHAAKPVKLMNRPEPGAAVLEVVQPGQVVGKVYSYVERQGKVWWVFEYANGGFYYVEHEQGKFDWSMLESQLPANELQKKGIPDYIMYGGIILGAAAAITARRPAVKIIGGTVAALIAGKLVADTVKKIDLNPFN